MKAVLGLAMVLVGGFPVWLGMNWSASLITTGAIFMVLGLISYSIEHFNEER